MNAQAPRGTADMLPATARAWEFFTRTAAEIFSTYGYEPMVSPMFETTEVFVRGIGEATDVVSKEMFSVMGPSTRRKLIEGEPLKDDEQLTLRPEGTASIVRATIEHNLVPPGAAPLKVYYSGPMFRYERPQKGRQRQFWQIGTELIGAAEPSADAEMILMLMRFFEAVGVPVENMRLLVNSMGDEHCRPAYRETIAAFIREHGEDLCEECNRRADTNPLRAFDCKNPKCVEVMARAPKIVDELCDECSEHYEQVLSYLDSAGIEYEEDPSLVRGLDYYTRTVFEVQVDSGLGSQNAIGGGGRYDKLMETVGGKPTPGIGFALGFERTMLALEGAGADLEDVPGFTVYVAAADPSVRGVVFSILQGLRDEDIRTESDHQNRSLKSQFKQADKLGARLTVIVGPDELAADEVIVRDMETKEEERVPLDEVVAHIDGIVHEWEMDLLFSEDEE